MWGLREPHRVRQLIGITGQYASVDEDPTAMFVPGAAWQPHQLLHPRHPGRHQKLAR
jgi:hypothetical protein